MVLVRSSQFVEYNICMWVPCCALHTTNYALMIILGIDPGTERAGYGVVQCGKGQPVLIEAGLFPVTEKDRSGRLFEIKRGIDAVIALHKPEMVAVEKLFFVKNQTTGIAVAEARGVILLAAREHGLPVREFSPTEVKMGVAGYGQADKLSVAKMVRLILAAPGLVAIDDAMDALAIALCASKSSSPAEPGRLAALLSRR